MSVSKVYSFLNQHRLDSEHNDDATHRVYGKEFSGNFKLDKEQHKEFMKLYIKEIKQGRELNVLETPKEYGPIVIDIDIKKKDTSANRLYDNKLIKKIVKIYNSEINKIIDDDVEVKYYILEKEQPTIKNDEKKDGFHIFVNGLCLNFNIRTYLWEQVVKKVDELELFDESADKIIDKAVVKSNGWFLYGSCKPGAKPYRLTGYYESNLEYESISIEEEKENLEKLIKGFAYFYYNENKKTPINGELINKLNQKVLEATQFINLADKLDTDFDDILQLLNLCSDNRAIDYTYWRNIALILKGLDIGAFLPFDKFSQRANDKYNEDKVKEFWDNIKPKAGGQKLTIGTLHYYAKEDSPKEYEEYRKSKKELTEFDIVYRDLRSKIEQEWFKLSHPTLYVRKYKEELQLKSAKDAKEYFKNVKIELVEEEEKNGKTVTKHIKIDFFDTWTNDKDIRTYEKIVFEPNLSKVDRKEYNIFDNFEFFDEDDKGEKIEEFEKLIKHIFKTPENIHYFYSWLHHIITKPHIKTEKAIVLYSDIHGAGKNSIIELIIKLLGEKKCGKVSSVDDFTKSFNSFLCKKFLIYGDEIDAKAKNLADTLKNIISQKKINLEYKGKDSIEINDCSNYIFTTNNELTFKVDKSDRRYFIVEIDNKLQKSDYDKFYESLEDNTKLKKFFNYIRNYKASDIIGVLPPMTNIKYRIVSMSSPAYNQYMYKMPENLAGRKIKANDLYELVREYAKKNYLSTSFTPTTFGKFMTELIEKSGDKIRKLRNKEGFVYAFPKIEDFLQVLKNYDKDFYEIFGTANLEKGDDDINTNSEDEIKNDLDI